MSSWRFFLIGLFIWTIGSSISKGQNKVSAGDQKIAIEWRKTYLKGTIEVLNGQLRTIEIVKGKGKIRGNSFDFNGKEDVRLIATLTNVQNSPGSDATIVTVRTTECPFSFFLRDVNINFPVFIPGYQVVVTSGDDFRSYSLIEADLKSRNLKTKLQQIMITLMEII